MTWLFCRSFFQKKKKVFLDKRLVQNARPRRMEGLKKTKREEKSMVLCTVSSFTTDGVAPALPAGLTSGEPGESTRPSSPKAMIVFGLHPSSGCCFLALVETIQRIMTESQCPPPQLASICGSRPQKLLSQPPSCIPTEGQAPRPLVKEDSGRQMETRLPNPAPVLPSAKLECHFETKLHLTLSKRHDPATFTRSV